MAGNAYRFEKLAGRPSASRYISLERSNWPNLSCLLRRHYYLVRQLSRTQRTSQSRSGSSTEGQPVLLGKEVYPLLSGSQFSGHHISEHSIEADPKKVERILNWLTPKSATEVQAFLGLVRYIADFLPLLADHNFYVDSVNSQDRG